MALQVPNECKSADLSLTTTNMVFHNFTIEIAVISNSYSENGANSSCK